jgi:AbrB family looped-hinge helix DNA binding protein
MQTSIDAAGRIVVPKALRDALRLAPGTELEIVAADGGLEISPLPTPMHLEGRGASTVAVPDDSVPPLTAELVRETLEGLRR